MVGLLLASKNTNENDRHSIHLWPHLHLFPEAANAMDATATCPRQTEIHLDLVIPRFAGDRSVHASVHANIITFAASVKQDSHFKEFVGRWAIMHYNSYVPELDLKPVQFEFNHQVSIFIIHIPTLTQQTAYVTYLQTNA